MENKILQLHLGRIRKVSHGFTLVELLIVIAIIGILSTTAVVNISSARDKAKIAKVLQQIESVHLALSVYDSDVGHYPVNDCRLCSQAEDPFSTQQTGEIGWSGPYLSLYNMTHSWGGHIGIALPAGSSDWNNNGILECIYIVLDDDLPGTNDFNNQAIIPTNILLAIDERIDDGNLNTGNMRGDDYNAGPAIPAGEAFIAVDCY